MLLGPRVLKSLNTIEKIQPRMLCASFNGNFCTTIISCFSPTNASDETNAITVCNQFQSLVLCIPKYNVLIIGGDINVQIDKD